MNVPTPVNHPSNPNNANVNNMRPAQPNAANFQNANRNWTPNFNNANPMTNNNANNKRPGLGFNQQAFKNRRPAQQTQNATKAQMTFYCEICKISCAGAQTYKEHTDGQKHKKREQAYKLNEMQMQQAQAALNNSQDAGQVQPTQTTSTTPAVKDAPKLVVTATNPNRNIHTVRCELCDVACSGRDSYLSHIRGSKHLKTLKLHKKLGKPIPPDFLDNQPATTAPQAASTQSQPAFMETSVSTNVDVVSSPTINPSTPAPAPSVAVEEKPASNGTTTQPDVLKSKPVVIDDEGNEPVGKEYVETRVEGKAVSFYCKLCDCQFNDPNAKEMHTKGRRHRLSYKKKVDPSLIVDLKGSRDVRNKQLQRDPRTKRLTKLGDVVDQANVSLNNTNGQIQPLMSSDITMIHHNIPNGQVPIMPPYQSPKIPANVPVQQLPQQLMSQQLGTARFSNPMSLVAKNPGTGESFDDRHVIAKHCAIFPSESEISKIQEIVTNSEKALKLVSDQIAEEDHAKANETAPATAAESTKTEPVEVAAAPPPPPVAVAKEDIQAFRALKGVMRVGLFSKNLMLKDDTDVQLVVLCAKKPTKSLLSRVHQILIKKIEVGSIQSFDQLNTRRLNFSVQ